ncbi:hypothetical protein ABIC27_002768 [Streptomyces sp. PvR034]
MGRVLRRGGVGGVPGAARQFNCLSVPGRPVKGAPSSRRFAMSLRSTLDRPPRHGKPRTVGPPPGEGMGDRVLCGWIPDSEAGALSTARPRPPGDKPQATSHKPQARPQIATRFSERSVCELFGVGGGGNSARPSMGQVWGRPPLASGLQMPTKGASWRGVESLSSPDPIPARWGGASTSPAPPHQPLSAPNNSQTLLSEERVAIYGRACGLCLVARRARHGRTRSPRPRRPESRLMVSFPPALPPGASRQFLAFRGDGACQGWPQAIAQRRDRRERP